MKRKPYIGITGIENQSQALQALEEADGMHERYLMQGILASYKTLHGNKTKYPFGYPEIGHIEKIFVNSPGVLNLIHYHTDHTGSILAQMHEVTRYGGPYVHGIQLNVAWPERWKLDAHKNRNDGQVIVLQCGRKALAACGLAVESEITSSALASLTRRVASYKDSIDYVLLDMSGGENISLDLSFSRACLTALAEHGVSPMLGTAGGLTAETLPRVAALFSEFPDLSIDGQGGFRDEDYRFNSTKAIRYIRTAREYFHC
ncbi:MAG: hypothetical protein Greene041614_911 [Parcubacteria group bacterium Greene0416_14]|nr:MAG: hypothetical protein Greene041614_911 [Parcubacteria group bacterium Greene0416_14]TSD00890.1 MAG: hypothetical protein Greene101415_604 [Parcubacteria group bacterium Greene1014_15]TSD07971.1 MAG: hypothetical protein Greene07144_512 [Parcubacteria group bacterium Greene0714_4]